MTSEEEVCHLTQPTPGFLRGFALYELENLYPNHLLFSFPWFKSLSGLCSLGWP